jgi:hypothetical protein
MKQTIYKLTFLILTSCGQSNSEQKTIPVSDTLSSIISDTNAINNNTNVQQTSTEEKQSQEEYRKQSLSGFKKATLYVLTDTIKADFNGDGTLDKAFYKEENETSGIIIKHGQTNEEFRIGFGKDFCTWRDFDCNWVDYWGLVEDKETFESIIKDDEIAGDRKVKLGKDEVGGGLITFMKGKYLWIHQTC